MTKTVDTVTRPSQVKDPSKSREASQSPPLVLKYLEALPPERELTLLVEDRKVATVAVLPFPWTSVGLSDFASGDTDQLSQSLPHYTPP